MAARLWLNPDAPRAGRCTRPMHTPRVALSDRFVCPAEDGSQRAHRQTAGPAVVDGGLCALPGGPWAVSGTSVCALTGAGAPAVAGSGLCALRGAGAFAVSGTLVCAPMGAGASVIAGGPVSAQTLAPATNAHQPCRAFHQSCTAPHEPCTAFHQPCTAPHQPYRGVT